MNEKQELVFGPDANVDYMIKLVKEFGHIQCPGDFDGDPILASDIHLPSYRDFDGDELGIFKLLDPKNDLYVPREPKYKQRILVVVNEKHNGKIRKRLRYRYK